MASEAPESVGRRLRQLFAGGGAAGLVDGQLLERLAAGRGAAAEAAFEAILDRHGSMVLATCRRVLGDRHAAEDAFQATFLVLVRRAGSLRVRDSLGPWLHGVAARTALKARTGDARRQARERRVAVPEASGAGDAGVDDLGAVLHAEVARLPAKYRAPVVLCYFEGRTHDEAAVTLGWPVGTVRGRLARARDLLRSRLARRGLAPAGVLGAMRTGPDSRAEVSAPLREATIGVATRGAAVGAGVAVLTRHTLRSLLMAKVKMTGVMAVAVALLATGAVLVAQGLPASRRPERPDPAPAAAARPDPAQGPAVDRSGDPLPDGARARMGTVRFHNGHLVNQVIYTPDGKSLVTVGWDHVVRVWDAASGRIRRDIGDPQTDFREIALSPDGKTLLTVEYPGLLRLWDFDSGRERRRSSAAPKEGYGHPAFSPDGTTLATSVHRFNEATKKNETFVASWDAATLAERHRVGGDWLQLWDLAFSPDGKLLATATNDTESNIVGEKPEKGSVRLRDAATGQELRRFPIEGFHARSVAFAPDGKLLAAGITDRTIRVYDVAAGEERAPRLGLEHALPPKPPEADALPVMGGEPRVMTCLAFAPDGSVLASGPEAPEVKGMFGLASIHLWDVATGKRLRQMPAHQQWVKSLSFSPDGKTLASSGAEPIVRLWDVAGGREAFPQPGHRSAVRVLAVSPADGTVLTGGYDGTVRRWDPASGRELGVVAAIDAPVNVLALAPDGQSFVLGTSAVAGPIALWDLATGRQVRQFPRVQPTNPVRHVALAPDGRTLASEYRVWDVTTGQVLVQFRDVDERVNRDANFFPVFYTPDSKRLITVQNDGVRVWDIASGKESSRPIRSLIHFHTVALSPDGRLLATGNLVARYGGAPAPDTPIRLWELASGREVATLDGHTEQVRSLAFSPDGRLLASASGADRSIKDRTVRVWDVATGRELRRFEGHLGAVNAVAFAPDGRSVISGSEDATALAWDVSDLRPGPAPGPLAAEELEARWAELAGDNAPAAHRAAWALGVEAAVAFLGDKLRPAVPPDPGRAAALIADLDSDRYATRAGAARALEELGAAAAPALRRALAGGPSAEVRGQAERLLAALNGPVTSPEVLRRLRAIAALERVGTPEARGVLGRLARGDPEARETGEARAALDRLGRRPGGQ